MTDGYSQIPVATNSCTVCGTICDYWDNICLNCNSWKCLICQNKNNSIQYFRSDEELRSHLLTHTGIVESTPESSKDFIVCSKERVDGCKTRNRSSSSKCSGCGKVFSASRRPTQSLNRKVQAIDELNIVNK